MLLNNFNLFNLIFWFNTIRANLSKLFAMNTFSLFKKDCVHVFCTILIWIGCLFLESNRVWECQWFRLTRIYLTGNFCQHRHRQKKSVSKANFYYLLNLTIHSSLFAAYHVVCCHEENEQVTVRIDNFEMLISCNYFTLTRA